MASPGGNKAASAEEATAWMATDGFSVSLEEFFGNDDPSAAEGSSLLPSSPPRQKRKRNDNDGPNNKKRKTRKTWEQRLEEVKAYKLEHGDCLVPRNYKQDPGLGRWVEMQRSNYQKYMKEKQNGGTPKACGGMDEERIALLEAQGFCWTFGRGMSSRKRDNAKPATSWLERFEELKAYKQQHGHCNVPVKHEENPKLGYWVSNQRSQYTLFQKERLEGNFEDPAVGGMTEERIAMLEQIGFSWVAPLKDHSGKWNERLEDLKEYKREYGHCSVAYNYTGHPRLVGWIKNQRQQYRHYQNAKEKGETDPRSKGMNEQRIAILEALGFTWTADQNGTRRRVR